MIYSKGVILKLSVHLPPDPYGNPTYRANWPATLPPTPTKSDNLVDYIFKHHPVLTPLPARQEERRVKITEQLSPDNSYGPRLLVCSDQVQGGLLFAKVYDPLYYRWEDDDKNFQDVVTAADGDYSREAAAYELLCKHHHNGAPKYFGSWTFTSSRHKNENRFVRLVLMEYIPARSLWQDYYEQHPHGGAQRIPPNVRTDTTIPECFRLEVLRRLMEILSRQTYIGVIQNDVAPRNVIAVLDSSKTHKVERVILVDYNISVVLPIKQGLDYEPLARPLNPMEVHWNHWNHWLSEFEGWFPAAWLREPDLRRKWLYDNFGPPAHQEEYMFESPKFCEEAERWLKGFNAL